MRLQRETARAEPTSPATTRPSPRKRCAAADQQAGPLGEKGTATLPSLVPAGPADEHWVALGRRCGSRRHARLPDKPAQAETSLPRVLMR